ncbi:MAG: Gfo/Idh/MocA family oxidoreductase [Planctomycetia bacterium]|nr:Gfo/Idh/MocA family oxidoreductase [Planctomycetia bacterium]
MKKVEFTRRSFLGTLSALGLASTAEFASVAAQENAGPQLTPAPYTPFSDRKIRVGLVGYGVCQFSAQFEFQHHPNFEIAAVSDLIPERCSALSEVVHCEKTYPSLEELVKDDSIEAVFLATDAPSHARHAILALEHGKHVATAVPAFFGNYEDAEKLLECVRKNRGLVYAMFETSTFHADLYAMKQIYAAGGFGRILYSEGEYCHSRDPKLPPIDSYNGWRKNMPPMWYVTHASAYYVGVTGQRLVDVSCEGIPYSDFDKPAEDPTGNPFSSEIGLFRTQEKGLARIMVSPSYGTYLEAGRVRGEIGGYDEFTRKYVGTDDGKRIVKKLGNTILKPELPPGVAPGGHGESHGYLCHDFAQAIINKTAPNVDIIAALNMTAPGWFAHQSALKDGETMTIPEFKL